MNCARLFYFIHEDVSVLSYNAAKKFTASNQLQLNFSRANRRKDARVQNVPRDREGTRGGPPTMADFTAPVLHDAKSYGPKRH